MSVTTLKAPTPAMALRNTLRTMSGEFAAALPSHIKPEKFERVVMTVVQLNPGLLNADRQSLLASCLSCAKDGLIPDGREAALVLFGNKVQYMPMFTGIQKRIRNSGEVASIQAHVIYENDRFVIRRGLNETIEHDPLFPGDRGKPIGAYAVAKFKDGSDPMFEVMDINAIERVRKVSKSSGSGPWVQWWDEMARKTVFRRLAKWLPMDAEMDDLLRRDDQAGAPTTEAPTIDAEPIPQTATPDPFEMASSGAMIEGEVTSPVEAAIDDLAACETLNDVAAWEANAAVKATLAKLAPEDRARVATAIDGRKKAFAEAQA